MLTSCDVTETAGRLSLQLEAQAIPDDYDPVGAYWQIIANVRHSFTNYDTLLAALPDCPLECPIAESNGDLTGQSCANYDLAHDILKTEARRLAMNLYRAWEGEAPAPQRI